MTDSWSLSLRIQGSNLPDTRALADALTTDETVTWSGDKSNFSFTLVEEKCKDLRAMWNTRIRGLIAVDSLLTTLLDEPEGSSTQTK